MRTEAAEWSLDFHPAACPQVYHYCHHDGRQDSFLCPKGTVFNQRVFVCDWWYNADCAESASLYDLNHNLYNVSYPAIDRAVLRRPKARRDSIGIYVC